MKNIVISLFFLLIYSCQEELGEPFHGLGYDHTSVQKFDKELIESVLDFDSLKTFLMNNSDTIIKYTYKDLDPNKVFTQVGEKQLPIESYSCASFNSFLGDFLSPKLPDTLISKFNFHLSKLDTSKLISISLCKDKEVSFFGYEKIINDSVLIIHGLTFYRDKPKKNDYIFKFMKDTLLEKNIVYTIRQVYNYHSYYKNLRNY